MMSSSSSLPPNDGTATVPISSTSTESSTMSEMSNEKEDGNYEDGNYDAHMVVYTEETVDGITGRHSLRPGNGNGNGNANDGCYGEEDDGLGPEDEDSQIRGMESRTQSSPGLGGNSIQDRTTSHEKETEVRPDLVDVITPPADESQQQQQQQQRRRRQERQRPAMEHIELNNNNGTIHQHQNQNPQFNPQPNHEGHHYLHATTEGGVPGSSGSSPSPPIIPISTDMMMYQSQQQQYQQQQQMMMHVNYYNPPLPAAPGRAFSLVPRTESSNTLAQLHRVMPPSAREPIHSAVVAPTPPGRRAIQLHLMEEYQTKPSDSNLSYASKLLSFRVRRRIRSTSQPNSLFFSNESDNQTVNSDSNLHGKRHKSAPDSDFLTGAASPSPSATARLVDSVPSGYSLLDRGFLSVSWYDGTSTADLREHVKRSVRRKLELETHTELENVRIIDETVEPHEEIVLSPYIPDGSQFILRFTLKDVSDQQDTYNNNNNSNTNNRPQEEIFVSRAPDSPSAAPSPRPSYLDLAILQEQINAMLEESHKKGQDVDTDTIVDGDLNGDGDVGIADTLPSTPTNSSVTVPVTPGVHRVNNDDYDGATLQPNGIVTATTTTTVENVTTNTPQTTDIPNKTMNKKSHSSQRSKRRELYHHDNHGTGSTNDLKSPLPHTNDLFAEHLKQLNELLTHANDKRFESDHDHNKKKQYRRTEKRQVIFILANYFVLFLSLIAVSAEIHERAPRWLDWINENVSSVQNCAADRDALFECVSNGDFSGLVASFILWATRSVTTKQIFLFGFESPKKLWTVVYEAGVTAVCWGTSYMFIRRGLNPDTRTNFLQKYWKDAVYGSLAGFNAAFMKAVLKNLIPQDQVLDVLEHRQLRIVNFLGHFLSKGKD